MIEISGIKYITEKEASQRYGHSFSWFQKRRYELKEPKFIRLEGRGKVYYPLERTDNWFKEQFKIDE